MAPDSNALNEVKKLWRKHAATLGFFPDGAFEDHARHGSIVSAHAPDDRLVGYVLFRYVANKSHVAIVHMCVDESARRQGVARELLRALLANAPACTDVVLRCRRDFEASQIWPRLGFVAATESPGRGQGDTILTSYRLAVGSLPLLACLEAHDNASAVRVVIDANVFFDLDDRSPGNEESRALEADWLSEYIELCVTDEIFNEIDRNRDPSARAYQRARSQRYRHVSCAPEAFDSRTAEVRAVIPGTSDSAESDIRQVTRTIAAGVNVFVTRDARILAATDALYEKFGLLVLAPHEVILRFDELRRVEHYRPRRHFIGPSSREEPARSGDFECIAQLVPFDQDRPRRLAALRTMLSSPESTPVTCVWLDEALLAAFALARPQREVFDVPIFAVAKGTLGLLAALHYAHLFASHAAANGAQAVRVTAFGGETTIALEQACYREAAEVWVKAATRLIATPGEMVCHLAMLAARVPELRPVHDLAASIPQNRVGPEVLYRLERCLWPSKFRNSGLPCFIVPIRPFWAHELFDHELARTTLFGADKHLSLSHENAYYRSARPAVLTAPGRVLWYVSSGAGYNGTKAIRACSYLDEVVCAPPREAFRAYRHLGVYRWQHVYDLAKADHSRNVQAFRFSMTELLKPIPFSRVRQVLAEHGVANQQFQSPLKIEEDTFMSLYEAGQRGDS